MKLNRRVFIMLICHGREVLLQTNLEDCVLKVLLKTETLMIIKNYNSCKLKLLLLRNKKILSYKSKMMMTINKKKIKKIKVVKTMITMITNKMKIKNKRKGEMIPVNLLNLMLMRKKEKKKKNLLLLPQLLK